MFLRVFLPVTPQYVVLRVVLDLRGQQCCTLPNTHLHSLSCAHVSRGADQSCQLFGGQNLLDLGEDGGGIARAEEGGNTQLG